MYCSFARAITGNWFPSKPPRLMARDPLPVPVPHTDLCALLAVMYPLFQIG